MIANDDRVNVPVEDVSQKGMSGGKQDRFYGAIYLVAFAVSVFIWLLAIRAPLWLDETGSYWHIYKGFSQIWPSNFQCPETPAYDYFLWLGSKIFGTSEVALRIPSLIAMFGAAYLLYLAGCELFESEIAIIATIIFCLNPIVVFAAVDVRPYAFGILAVNAAILCVLRLRRNHSNWLAALFGLSTALIVYFHLLLGVILPALLICFFVTKSGDRKGQWRQLGIALAVFAIAMLPVIPSILFMFQNPASHVFEAAPTLQNLIGTFTPVKFRVAPMSLAILLYTLVIGAFVVTAVVTRMHASHHAVEVRKILICASLALIPILILFGVSAGTSVHIFATRHRVEAIPGIALCWATLFILLKSRTARLAFCLLFVVATVYQSFSEPQGHNYSWKRALEFAEKNATADNAQVMICSDFPESDYAMMPIDSAKDSIYFAQLSYYKLSVPVVPMPRALNDEAVRVGSRFFWTRI